jgi:hypothetical protein
MRILITLFSLFLLLLSCKNNSEDIPAESFYSNQNDSVVEDEEETNEEELAVNGYSDDTYCAEVEYYNPNTGTRSNYTLTVEVYNNEVTEINFPQGWLDGDQFSSEELDKNGECDIRTYRGYQYSIKIIGSSSGCFEDEPKAIQCNGVTDDGTPCEHLTDNQNGYCWQHQDQE